MMTFLLALFAVWGALRLADAVILYRWRRPATAPELHWATTADGVRVGLHRHPRPGAEPVLLVHGLGANHANFDFDPPHGVAQWLAARGYDCWVLDLRGRGASEVPRRAWTFEDYVDYDIPAAVALVLQRTGYAQLHWVGHSMGGMLFYAFAGAMDQGDVIASAVTLGSPVRFFAPSRLERAAVRAAPWLRRIGVLWLLPAVVRWAAVLYWLLPRKLLAIQYNPDNVEMATIRAAAATAVAPTSVPLLLQFADWIVHHRWCSVDATRDYRAGLRRIRVPTCVIAGTADYLCPGFFAKYAYDAIATDDKAFCEFGLSSGALRDYGHIDLVFGARADTEVYPRIGEWLAAHPLAGAAVNT